MGRSDTVIMTTYKSSPPYVGMLSVPRDLWVEIPGQGFNRINTANFFAEIENPGTGSSLAIETIRHNFGVEMDYYIRVDFLGFLELIDVLGGIVIQLPTPMAGYDTGPNHLNGEQALAFVRDRQNGDDFSRMEQGQILIRGLLNRSLDPQIWVRLPEILPLLQKKLETNLPFWRWPQLAFVIFRVGSKNIDARTIDHDMVNPFTTEGGASVLAPQWDRINPIILEMFGQ
jgi:LCP family protein required for cell wall assembly